MADTAAIAAAMRANPTRNIMSGMSMSNRLHRAPVPVHMLPSGRSICVHWRYSPGH